MKKIANWTCCIAFAAAFFFSAFAQQAYKTDYLSNVRKTITFPELTSDEKRLIAEQALILFRDLYVNRLAKQDFYSYPLDPLPAIEEVLGSVDELSTEQFEGRVYEIFVSQRDLHLNYVFPKPYADFETYIPLTFTRVKSVGDPFEVRVESVNAEKCGQFYPGQRVPRVGDRVLAYGGLPVGEAVKGQLQTAQGANQYGGFSRALGMMTFIPHRLHLVPAEDAVRLTLQSFETGEVYDIDTPWLTLFPQPSSRLPGPGPVRKRSLLRDDLLQSIDLWQEEFNEFCAQNGLTPSSAYPENDSDEPTVKWGLIQNAFGTFGYIKVTSFVPERGDAFALDVIARLLQVQLGKTKGLIVDVRDNGGGSIVYADKMSQLFMPRSANAAQARLLNTDLNRYIFNNSSVGPESKPEWTRVINEAEGTGRTYTETAPFTYASEANELGQAYYKPVAVLADARSYSATDLFTCAMQDNLAATIFGEDPKTGAGGANVITHSSFCNSVGKPFVPLPKGHAMRVSWRQSVRFGRNAGVLIEDNGCGADYDVSLSLQDLLGGNAKQIEKITWFLTLKSALYTSGARSQYVGRELAFAREEPALRVKVRGTAYVNTFVDGALCGTVHVPTSTGETEVSCPLPEDLPSKVVHRVELSGFSLQDEQVWNMKRDALFFDTRVSVGGGGFRLDFGEATSAEPFVVFNFNTLDPDGWNLQKPYLVVGRGPTYENDVNTDAAVLLDARGRQELRLSFGGSIDTEAGYDIFSVFASTNDGADRVLFSGSGVKPMAEYSFDLSEFAGQNDVCVHFRFTSDAAVVGPGVKLSYIEIR